MAVNIKQRDHYTRGSFYEVTMSAVGDVFQAHFLKDVGHKPFDWDGGDVSWARTVDVTVTRTNGAPEDLGVNPENGNGIAGGMWIAHPSAADRSHAEGSPATGLRFKATKVGQRVVLWTRYPLQEGAVTEVKGV